MSTKTLGEQIVIFGAGGHAKSVISVLEAEGRWRLFGLLEDGDTDPARRVLGYRVLGTRREFATIQRAGVQKALVAIGDNALRGAVADQMERSGFTLIRIMHPTACLMKDAQVGAGSFVHALSLIGPECQVGRNAIIQPHTSLGHESRIGDAVQFCPGVHIGGKTRIGDYCFLGPGAVVYPGVTIGKNVSIGANTVVHKDIPDDMIIVGNQARPAGRNLPLEADRAYLAGHLQSAPQFRGER